MNMTFFDFFRDFLLFLPFAIAAKVISEDKKMRLKENLYLLLIICLYVLMIGILLDHLLPNLNAIASALLWVVPFSATFLYFFKIKRFSFSDSVIFLSVTVILMKLINTLFLIGIHMLFPDYSTLIASKTSLPSVIDFARWLPFLLGNIFISALVTYLYVKVTSKLWGKINDNRKSLKIVSLFSALVLFIVHFSAAFFFYQNELLAFIASWNTLLLIGALFSLLAGFLFYITSLNAKFILEKQQAEQAILQCYTDQLEEQQIMVRKYKHDFQNIILAMEQLIITKDWDGLTRYFVSVKGSTIIIDRNNVFSDSLSNIKVKEIKSILSSKLFKAINLNINTTFYCNDTIENFTTDPVTLVRILSIILDNAIEASEKLGTEKAKLAMTLYKVKESIHFSITNATPPPKVRSLCAK
ncbi:MAG: GHKL domain-containing protein [Lachnospiraceae bacterium]|nr:GHKL domain-containing protein [Lachnospiraceae bacterium]